MSPKTVVIAGATRGIGLELAKQYTNAGWQVIARILLARLKAVEPHKIVIYDALDDTTITLAVEQLEGMAIDLLINSMGVHTFDTLETASSAEMQQLFVLNAVSPFLLPRALLPNLKRAAETNGFAIIANMSSMGGSIELAGLPRPVAGSVYAYRASKASLNMLHR
ncbi:unnamed protein product [Phytophthora lilii]|uniref:Unnamed protein product n=1 Tax=Phytophthora lilii TaxID=2077276 RepID=A0A9W6U4T6_9STRA|nr:unnamed protein product [Phytophthora lilii]